MATATKFESTSEAFELAQSISGIGGWTVLETRSGAFQLRLIGKRNAMINALVNPCRMNHGEVSKPYQVWRRNGFENWATLADAVADAIK